MAGRRTGETSDSNQKHESGLSEIARKALDAILNRDKDDQDKETPKGSSNSSSSVGRQEGKSGGSAADILSAGTQGAARSTNRAESSTEGGVSVGKRAGSSGSGSTSGAFDAASAGSKRGFSVGGRRITRPTSPASTDASMGDGGGGPVEE